MHSFSLFYFISSSLLIQAAFLDEGVSGTANSKYVQQRIIDADDRNLVFSTESAPWGSIGKIGSCTGTLIGPRHVLTAGHCVYSVNQGEYSVTGMQFSPGQNGNFKPFGTYYAKGAIVPNSLKNSKSVREGLPYDYAVVILTETVSSSVPRMSFGASCSLKGVPAKCVGYPHDQHGKMISSSCLLKMDCSQRTAYHSCDTLGGMSGAPLLVGNKVAAVHHTSHIDTYNIATILNSNAVSDIRRMMTY